jgi:hypothetical protein
MSELFWQTQGPGPQTDPIMSELSWQAPGPDWPRTIPLWVNCPPIKPQVLGPELIPVWVSRPDKHQILGPELISMWVNCPDRPQVLGLIPGLSHIGQMSEGEEVGGGARGGGGRPT